MAKRPKWSGSAGSIWLINILSVLLSFIIVLSLVLAFIIASPFTQPRDFLCKLTHNQIFCQGIIDVQTVTVNGDQLSIGLSDGNYAFDTSTSNHQSKQQAAQDYTNGNLNAAIGDWNQAISKTTDDAESMIYREDAQITTLGVPYVTVVVATTLSSAPKDKDTSTSLGVGEDDLRGVYLAQKDFDQQHSSLKLRIIIANLGVKDQNYLEQTENIVLQKITRLAYTDSTFVGVEGFPFSATIQIARDQDFFAAHIPLVSPSASSSSFTNVSPYFFRTVPTVTEEGKYAAQFASEVLNVRRIAVFSDSTNPYSKSLSDNFTTSFRELGSDHVVIPESFQLSMPDSLDAPIKNMLSQNPPVDMIYLAGYANDINNLKLKLKADNISLLLMAGEASYEFNGYTNKDYRDFYFSAFTYPDLWQQLCPSPANCTSPAPEVTDPIQYSQLFDPQGLHPGTYGYGRPGPHVWQSYDAITALLQAVNAVQTSGQGLSLQTIRDALQKVSFQGVTDYISFENGGSDIDKTTVLMLCVDSHYHTQLLRVYGQLVKGQTFSAPDSNKVCA